MAKTVAENSYITGLANVGGVIAFCVIAFGFFRWMIRFLKEAYRSNVKTALRRSVRIRLEVARRAAADLHYLIIRLALLSLILILSSLSMLIGLIAMILSYVGPEEEKISRMLVIAPTWDTVSANIIVIAPMALLAYGVFQMFFFLKFTSRARTKLLRRMKQKKIV